MRMDSCIHNIDDVDCGYDIDVKDCDPTCPFYEVCDNEIN